MFNPLVSGDWMSGTNETPNPSCTIKAIAIKLD